LQGSQLLRNGFNPRPFPSAVIAARAEEWPTGGFPSIHDCPPCGSDSMEKGKYHLFGLSWGDHASESPSIVETS
tara:strand:- start:319 stop:540 length:222 start_codon:yes stop_codon:yes gene_type:complete